MERYKVFLVEDDEVICQSLTRQLEGWGYEVCPVQRFDRVLEEFEQLHPDLVLMDVSPPFLSGYHWCAQIRQQSRLPILFLSSAGDDMNLVMAINMGADDFVAKPFRIEVLVAKIQALLRRAYSFGAEPQTLRAGNLVLDLSEAAVLVNGVRQNLSKNEYGILRILMERKGRTVSREEIIQRLWQSESFIDDNTLSVNVARLRKTLQSLGAGDCITTRKGMGYQLEDAR